MGWKVLISSRGQVLGIKPISIEELPLDESKELFYRSYQKQKDEPALEQLLELIKRHTLLIEIFAKVANKHPDLDIKGLYQIMKTHDLKQEKLKVNIDLENYILTQQEKQEEIQCREFLLKIFGMEKLDAYEKQALLYFSVLANGDYSIPELEELFFIKASEKIFFVLADTYWHLSFLKWLYKSIKNYKNNMNIFLFNWDRNNTKFINLINGLVEKGLVQKENNNFRVHPLIKEISLEIQSPSVENCVVIISSLNSFITNDISSDKILLSEKQLQRWLEITELIRERHPNVAKSYNNIGGAYNSKGKYDKAIEYYKQAIDILKVFVSEDHPKLKDLRANYEYVKKKAEEAGL